MGVVSLSPLDAVCHECKGKKTDEGKCKNCDDSGLEGRYWVKVSDTFMYQRSYHEIKKENITSSDLEQAFGIRDGARLTHPEKLNLPANLRDALLKKVHYKRGDFKSDLIHKEAGTFETGLYGSSETWWKDFVKLHQTGRLSKLEFVRISCSMCKGAGICRWKKKLFKCQKCNGSGNSWKKRTDGKPRGSGALGEDSEDSEDFVPRRRLAALDTRFQRVRDFQVQTE